MSDKPQSLSPIRRRLDTNQAAELLGLSARTLSTWRCRGDGPPFLKIGGAVRYDEQALEAWAATRARTSTSDPGPRAA